MLKSWDVKLAGQPYVFGSSPGISLGAALTEPGQPSQVGSVVIASWHGGIGRGFDEGMLQYDEATDADLTVPNAFLPGYSVQSVGSFTASNQSIARPAFGYGDGAKTVWVIAGQSMRYFAPANPGGGLTTVTIGGAAFPANSELSGSAFQYNDELILGIINNDSGNEGRPAAYAQIDIDTPGTATVVTTDEDSNAVGISYGASTRARAFWVEADGLRWAPSVAGAVFKDYDGSSGTDEFEQKPTEGTPGIVIGKPWPSWLTMIGPALLIFRQDGAIVGADETGLLTIAGQVVANGLEVNFGHRAAPYHDGVFIPSRTGLWSFNAHSLTLRPASPNYIQGEPLDRLRGEVMAANGAGPYGFVALRQVSAGGTITSVAYMIVRYQDRISVHDLIPTTGANEVIVDFLPWYDTTTRRLLLYYLVHNESTDSISVRYKPLRLPSDQHAAGTNIASASSVELASVVGPSPAANMTKLWLQVRGYFRGGTGGACQLDFSNFTVDGAAVTLASVTADGPFAVPFGGAAANRLGRELTSGTVTLTSPVVDSRLDLPLTFDYVWVPSTQDALTMKLLVSGEVGGRVAANWNDAPWARSKALLDLRGTVTTLAFPEGDSWTVLVEGVQLDDVATPDGAGQTARVATVQVRRLT
jgi:hypothetical protein